MCDMQYKKKVRSKTLPMPHPSLNAHNSAPLHNVQAKFGMFRMSSLPIRGIKSCEIEALSNLVPHLNQLHTLALWGRLWSGLGTILEWVWASDSLVLNCHQQHL